MIAAGRPTSRSGCCKRQAVLARIDLGGVEPRNPFHIVAAGTLIAAATPWFIGR